MLTHDLSNTHPLTYISQTDASQRGLSELTFFSSRYLARSQGFRWVESADISTTPKGFGGFMSAVWMWLRLCVYVVTGHGEPLEVDVQRAVAARRPNRARRHLTHHFTKPSVRGGAKPALMVSLSAMSTDMMLPGLASELTSTFTFQRTLAPFL